MIRIKEKNITTETKLSIKVAVIGNDFDCLNSHIDTLTRNKKTTLFIGLPNIK